MKIRSVQNWGELSASDQRRSRVKWPRSKASASALVKAAAAGGLRMTSSSRLKSRSMASDLGTAENNNIVKNLASWDPNKVLVGRTFSG